MTFKSRIDRLRSELLNIYTSTVVSPISYYTIKNISSSDLHLIICALKVFDESIHSFNDFLIGEENRGLMKNIPLEGGITNGKNMER